MSRRGFPRDACGGVVRACRWRLRGVVVDPLGKSCRICAGARLAARACSRDVGIPQGLWGVVDIGRIMASLGPRLRLRTRLLFHLHGGWVPMKPQTFVCA